MSIYTIPVTIPSSVLRHYSRCSESSLPGFRISKKKNVLHKSPVFLLTPGLHSMLAPLKSCRLLLDASLDLPLSFSGRPGGVVPIPSVALLLAIFMDCLHNLCHVPESFPDSSFSHAPSAECIFELFCLCGRVR